MSRAVTRLCAYAAPFAARLLPGVAGPSVLPILCYHDVALTPRPGVVSFDRFREQLDLMEREYRVTAVGEALAGISETRLDSGGRIVISFDDAMTGAIALAVPELERRGLPYTVFVIANEAGSGCRKSYASLSDILSACSGHGTIGAHSTTHRVPLTMLTDADLAGEFQGSMELLEQCGSNGLRLFCYPWAAYDDRVEAACRNAGFDAAFAGQWLRHHSPARLYRLGRVTVDHDDDPWSFAAKLAGARDAQALWLEWRRRKVTPAR